MPDFAAPGPHGVAISDGEWFDEGRSRTLKWRCYAPANAGAHPIVLYSHGLGGSRESGVGWLAHWASWGIAAVAVQHPGTDVDMLAGKSPLAMRQLLRQAANPDELCLRQHDLRHAIDRIAAGATGPFGISGHSFGAVSAMRLIGERRGVDDSPADPRIAAAILFSPSARGGTTPMEQRFTDVKLPCLHLTGSSDDGIGPGDIEATDRHLPFQHSTSPNQHLLVLHGAGHRTLAGQGDGTTTHLRLLAAISTAFWLSHLQGDRQAEVWLAQAFPGLLSAQDRLAFR